MIVRLDSEEVMNMVCWLLYPTFTFKLIKSRIDYGGLNIHGEYHLKVVAYTELRDSIGEFPPFPYEIWIVAQLATANMILFVDVNW